MISNQCCKRHLKWPRPTSAKKRLWCGLDRDFDLQTLDGNQVGQYLQLWNNGAITQETLLGALKKGEILPDVDVEEEVELTGQEKLDNMLTEMVPGEAAAPTER